MKSEKSEKSEQESEAQKEKLIELAKEAVAKRFFKLKLSKVLVDGRYTSLEEELEEEEEEEKEKEKELRKTFDTHDEDGSGSIDIAEFERIAIDLGEPLSQEGLQEIVRDLDKDGSGVVSYDEFIRWWKKDKEIDWEGKEILLYNPPEAQDQSNTTADKYFKNDKMKKIVEDEQREYLTHIIMTKQRAPVLSFKRIKGITREDSKIIRKYLFDVTFALSIELVNATIRRLGKINLTKLQPLMIASLIVALKLTLQFDLWEDTPLQYFADFIEKPAPPELVKDIKDMEKSIIRSIDWEKISRIEKEFIVKYKLKNTEMLKSDSNSKPDSSWLRMNKSRKHRKNKSRKHRKNKSRKHRKNKSRKHRKNKSRKPRKNKSRKHRKNKYRKHNKLSFK